MAKSYKDYSEEMRSRLSPEGRAALEAFSNSYALGLSLVNARHARKMTQKQLSELTGINQSEISKIETGSLSINTATLFRLLNALGATVRIELVEVRPGAKQRDTKKPSKARRRPALIGA